MPKGIIDQLNLADASAKADEETSLQIWQTHVPNSYEFPMDDFLHIGFSHHTLILSKVKDMNERLFYIRHAAGELHFCSFPALFCVPLQQLPIHVRLIPVCDSASCKLS